MATQEELLFIMRMQDGMSAVLASTRTEMDSLGRSAAATKIGLEGLQSAMGQVAVAAGLIAASTAGIKATLGVFASYEQAMSAVQKTTNLTVGEMVGFKAGFDRLATVMPVSIKDLGEIAAAAGSLGISGVDNILKFTETIAKLGVSTNLSGEFASQSLARMLNVMKEAPASVDRLASVIATLDNNSAATAREIAHVGTEVALATATYGIGTTKSVAFGASMAELGIQAERGGTAIGRTFIALDQAIRGNLPRGLQDLIKITGMTQAQMRALFDEDPTAMFMKFAKGLKDTMDAGKNYFVVLQDLTLNQAQTNKSLVPLINNYDELVKKLKLAADEALNPQQLNREFNIFADNMAQKLILLDNNWKLLGKDIGAAIAPATKAGLDLLTQALRDMDERFKTLSPGVQQTIASIVALGVPLLSLLVTLRLLIPVFGFLAAGLAGPWGLAAVAIAGVAAQLLIANGYLQRSAEVTAEQASQLLKLANGNDVAASAIRSMTEQQADQLRQIEQIKLDNVTAQLSNIAAQLKGNPTASFLNGMIEFNVQLLSVSERIQVMGSDFRFFLQRAQDDLRKGAINAEEFHDRITELASAYPQFANITTRILGMVDALIKANEEAAKHKQILNELSSDRPGIGADVPKPEGDKPVVPKPIPTDDFKPKQAGGGNALQRKEFLEDQAQRIKSLNEETAALGLNEAAYTAATRAAKQAADVQGVIKHAESLKYDTAQVKAFADAYKAALIARDDAKLQQDQKLEIDLINRKITDMSKETEALGKGKLAYDAYKASSKIDDDTEAFARKLRNLGLEEEKVLGLVDAYRKQAEAMAAAKVQFDANAETQKDIKQLASDATSELFNEAEAWLTGGKSATQAANDFATAVGKMIINALLLKPLEKALSGWMDSVLTPGSTGATGGGLGGLGGLFGGIAKLFGSGAASSVGSVGASAVGGFSSAAESASAASAFGIGDVAAAFVHQGGVIGATNDNRMVDPRLFFNAPRYHQGLGSDEFAAILQRGERVVTANQNDRLRSVLGAVANASGGGATTSMVVNFNAPQTEDTFRRAAPQIAQRLLSVQQRAMGRNR